MYKTKNAFNYLLHEESVANDVINASLFAYDEIALKTWNVNKGKQNIDKNVWESKKYGVTRLIKEFSNKKWSKRGVKDFLKRLRSTGSIERGPGSGRCEPHHRRVDESSVGLCRRWRQTFWALLMIATFKITMSKWQL